MEYVIVLLETFALYFGLVPAIFWIYGYSERVKPLWTIQIIFYSLILLLMAFITATEQAPVQRKGCKNTVKHRKKDRVLLAVTMGLIGLSAFVFGLWNLWQIFYSCHSRSRVNGHDKHHILSRRYGEWESRLNPAKFLVLLLLS